MKSRYLETAAYNCFVFLTLGVSMKKSLIALAVLAASGASFAQSSVTVYGLLDIWGGVIKSEKSGVSTSTAVLESGGVNTSRWGLKGSEDLGGGLKAVFKLEQGFKLDTGAAGTSTGAGQAFDRQSYVGFAGGFGEVAIGKVWSAYDDVNGASNAVFDSALAPANNVFKSIGYQDRVSNAVRYTSPTVGGLTGVVSYSLDEKAAGGLQSTAVSLSYAAGPLAAQFAYQKDDNKANASDPAYTRLGVSYDLGVATVKGTYGKVSNLSSANGANTTEYQIGADFPVSTVLTVSASYAKSDDNATAGNASRKGLGFAGAYTLSKRTFLYGGFEHNTTTVLDGKTNIFALGVQHNF
jgi:predicted porin